MGKLQAIKVLTNNKTEMIHETALQVLSDVGISLSESAIVSYMKEAGAWQRATDSYVCISRDMVETALNKATHHFSLYDRLGGELPLNGCIFSRRWSKIPVSSAGQHLIMFIPARHGSIWEKSLQENTS